LYCNQKMPRHPARIVTASDTFAASVPA
jgi:hypothetical protein